MAEEAPGRGGLGGGHGLTTQEEQDSRAEIEASFARVPKPQLPQDYNLDESYFWEHRYLPEGSVITYLSYDTDGIEEGRVAVLVESAVHDHYGVGLAVKLLGTERTGAKTRLQRAFKRGMQVHLCRKRFQTECSSLAGDGHVHIQEFFWHPPGRCDWAWLSRGSAKLVKDAAQWEVLGREKPPEAPRKERPVEVEAVEGPGQAETTLAERLGALKKKSGPRVTIDSGKARTIRVDGGTPGVLGGTLALPGPPASAQPKRRAIKDEPITVDSDGETAGAIKKKKRGVGEVLAQAADTRQKREALVGKKRSRSRSRKKRRRKKKKRSSSSEGSGSEKEEESSSDDMVAPLKRRSKREPGSVFTMLETQAIERFAQDGILEAEDPHVKKKARMYTYFQLGLKPQLNPQSRDSKEISMLARSLNLLKEGRLPELADTLAARLVAVNTAASQGWHTARFLEVHQPEEDGPVPPHVLLQAQRHGRRVDKAGGKGSWGKQEWSWGWNQGSPEKGKGKGKKGKGKKGKEKGKYSSAWNGGEKEKVGDRSSKGGEK